MHFAIGQVRFASPLRGTRKDARQHLFEQSRYEALKQEKLLGEETPVNDRRLSEEVHGRSGVCSEPGRSDDSRFSRAPRLERVLSSKDDASPQGQKKRDGFVSNDRCRTEVNEKRRFSECPEAPYAEMDGWPSSYVSLSERQMVPASHRKGVGPQGPTRTGDLKGQLRGQRVRPASAPLQNVTGEPRSYRNRISARNLSVSVDVETGRDTFFNRTRLHLKSGSAPKPPLAVSRSGQEKGKPNPNPNTTERTFHVSLRGKKWESTAGQHESESAPCTYIRKEPSSRIPGVSISSC